MALEEKTPVLVAASTIPVPEHRTYEDFRVTGTLKLNETVYILVKHYDDKGGETVIGEYKMCNDKETKDSLMDCNFVAKLNFTDQAKPVEIVKEEEIITP